MTLSRSTKLQIEVLQQSQRSRPLRLSVGDLIRSRRFELGFKANGETKIHVGWEDTSHPDHHADQGHGVLANDASRADATFMVYSLSIAENTGPDDALPDLRLALNVNCVRLTDDFVLLPAAEEIYFSQYEPMSIAQPSPEEIQLVGVAKMPVGHEGVG